MLHLLSTISQYALPIVDNLALGRILSLHVLSQLGSNTDRKSKLLGPYTNFPPSVPNNQGNMTHSRKRELFGLSFP